MTDFLWSIFRDTGDPMCYLLCRADEKNKAAKKKDNTEKSVHSDGGASASV